MSRNLNVMSDLDLLECCQAVLSFLYDEHEYAHFGLSETLGEMERVLTKNDFESSVFGTNMMNFMRWLSNEYNFDSPDIYDDGRSYFSDGFKFSKAPAKTFLKAVIREIKLKELLCQKE
jgi:hypothetical protein